MSDPEDPRSSSRLRKVFQDLQDQETKQTVPDNQESSAPRSSPTEIKLDDFSLDKLNFSEEDLAEIERIQKRLEILKSPEKKDNKNELIPFDQEFINKLKDLVPEIVEAVVVKYRMDRTTSRERAENTGFYNQVRSNTEEIIRQSRHNLSVGEQNFLVDMVVDEVIGYGPITRLIKDESVSEIMVNDLAEVYAEKEGGMELTDVFFISVDQMMRCVSSILKDTNRSVDQSSPSVDATLPDGSRIHIIIPPLTTNTPKITIRKFKKTLLKIEDLIGFGTLTHDLAYFLGACVKASLNIVVCGGTSTGKTTFLNILSSLIPEGERVITIEDSLELKFHQNKDNIIRLQTRDPNMEGVGEVTTTDLLKDSLRMRPDRIVVGEVRGREFLDMLQAMNTGHDGSFTTLHANTPHEAIFRLVNLALLSGFDLSDHVVRRQIGSSVKLFVQLKRFKDGSRRISHITEVFPDNEHGLLLKDIFRFEHQGFDKNRRVIGKFKCIRRPDHLIELFQLAGIEFPEKVFETVSENRDE